MSWRVWFVRRWASFSHVGLVVGTLLFAASLTPSLLPRHFLVQGILSGIALAVGYAVGVFLKWLWSYLELPMLDGKAKRVVAWVAWLGALAMVAVSLWWAAVWQNSIRGLMELPPLETAYPTYVAAIALLCSALLIGTARLVGHGHRIVDGQLRRVLPRRIANVASVAVVVFLVLTLGNRMVARQALRWADRAFLNLDELVEDGIARPADDLATGSLQSRIEWESIGRRGKHFLLQGPTEQQLSEFWGRPCLRPLRVYAGLRSAETAQQRAELALEELQRVGGFDRSLLVVANPTGTGWLDPGAVDTLEYLHGGDTAIVAMQYSYLPSWMTILVDPNGSRDSARVLFDKIYQHWRTLPAEGRPRLYLHGLSLGAFGSEVCADLFTLFEDPIQGGLWSGPPFPSSRWIAATSARNPGSPAWQPEFRDGRMLRFVGRDVASAEAERPWGPMRFVYLQHASDPMTFFAPELLFQAPEWLIGERGPDVSPYLTWYPIITFLQTAFDLPMATSVPCGYGHNFAPASYIEAWILVTEPEGWDANATARLKQRF